MKASDNIMDSTTALVIRTKEVCVKSLDLDLSFLIILGNTLERAWPWLIHIIPPVNHSPTL